MKTLAYHIKGKYVSSTQYAQRIPHCLKEHLTVIMQYITKLSTYVYIDYYPGAYKKIIVEINNVPLYIWEDCIKSGSQTYTNVLDGLYDITK